MNVVTRGIRNAFRNSIRTVSIVVIIGLAIGLSLAMLIARQAVSAKIASVNSNIGNTVTIQPAGFSAFSQVNNALTTTELSKVSSLPHIIGLNESLTDRLTTIGSSTPSFEGNSSNSSSNNQTSLTSPVTINFKSQSGGGGGSVFISGGDTTLPTNFTPPITIIGTNNPSSVNGTTLALTSGSLISGSQDNNTAVVSKSMASKNNLKVGSTFTAYAKTLTVSGIFSGSNNPLTNDIIVSLPTEQALSGQSNDVTSAVATVDSLTDLSAATNEIKSALGSSVDVTSSVQQAQNTTAPLNNIKSITLYSLIGAIVAGAVIIFLIMIMIVRERRREIGVLKAIGASNLKVMWQFISEAVTLTILGAVIGIAIGAASASPITNTLVSNSSPTTSVRFGGGGGGSFRAFSSGGGGNFSLGPQVRSGAFRGVRNTFSNIHAIIGWSIILYGIAAALIIAILGSTAASFLIAKIRPAEVIRTE